MIKILIGGGLFLILIGVLLWPAYPEVISDEKRGCLASAYQSEKRGFDLAENLVMCEGL